MFQLAWHPVPFPQQHLVSTTQSFVVSQTPIAFDHPANVIRAPSHEMGFFPLASSTHDHNTVTDQASEPPLTISDAQSSSKVDKRIRKHGRGKVPKRERNKKEAKYMSAANRMKVQQRADQTRESRMQKDADVLMAVQLHEQGEGKFGSLRQIARHFDCSLSRVQRIMARTAKFDGTVDGRPTLLSTTAEGLLVSKLRELVERGNNVDGEVISRIAQAIWRSENPDARNVPSFGSAWRASFNRRNPLVSFAIKSAKGQQARRTEASVRSNINHLMQGIKGVFNKFRRPVDPKDFIERKRVFVLDEVGIGNFKDDVSSGKRSLSLGNVSGYHVLSGSQAHLTAIPLVNMYDGLVCNTFVAAGNPNVDPNHSAELQYQRPLPLPDNCQLIFNTSGSTEGRDEQGRPGSWHYAVKHMVHIIEKNYGTKEAGRPDVLLIMDGFVVHKDSEELQLLAERGMHVVILAPNATHLVQVSDHPRMNGKLQERIRSSKSSLQRTFGEELPLEDRLRLVFGKIMETFDMDNLVDAATDIGYVVTPTHIGLTDESISRMLDAKEANGSIRGFSTNSTDTTLRSNLFLLARQLVREGALPIGTASVVSEASLQATERSSAIMKVAPIFAKPQKRARRISAKNHFEEGRQGTYLATSSGALAAAQAKVEGKRKRRNDTETNTAEDTKRQDRAADEAARKARLAALQEAFPGVDIQPFLRYCGRYLTGKNDKNGLDWAKARVVKHLSKQ